MGMVEKLILRRDGFPSGTRSISLSPKGGSGSTERGYRPAGGLFCIPQKI